MCLFRYLSFLCIFGLSLLSLSPDSLSLWTLSFSILTLSLTHMHTHILSICPSHFLPPSLLSLSLISLSLSHRPSSLSTCVSFSLYLSHSFSAKSTCLRWAAKNVILIWINLLPRKKPVRSMNKVGGDKNSDERESSTSFTVCQSLSLVLAHNAHTHTFTAAHRPK